MLHGLLGGIVCRQFCLSLAAFLCGRLCDSLCREWYSCVRCRSRLDQLVAVAEVELLNDEDDDDADTSLTVAFVSQRVLPFTEAG